MEQNIAKAGDIAAAFEETFATPEAINTGNSLTPQIPGNSGKSTKNAGEDEVKKMSIEPEYFTMKNPDTWGFK